MTLCIAHKINSMIFLASDSRINVADHFADNAIKVLPLAISITSPIDSNTRMAEKLYDTTLGFAFAGTFAAQNVIKDFLSIALQQLQFIPTLGQLTFEKICSYVMDLYKHVSIELSNKIKDQDIIDFFLCGTCPKDNIVKLAKFSIIYNSSLDDCKPQFKIYKFNEEFPLAIGSGEDQFHIEYKNSDTLPIINRAINALKKVIDNENIPSVGGNIQYGECHPGSSFSVKGVIVPRFDTDGTPKTNRFYLGGIDVLDDVFSEMHGLYMTGEFIKPFS